MGGKLKQLLGATKTYLVLAFTGEVNIPRHSLQCYQRVYLYLSPLTYLKNYVQTSHYLYTCDAGA